MGISEITALMQKMIENMESYHILILGICITVCITIIILLKSYISSKTTLRREKMLIEAGQVEVSNQVFQTNVFFLSKPDYKES